MREWLASIVGESLAPIMTVILAAALVVLLALVLIGLAKRVFAGSGGIGGRSRAPRLAVLDMAPVDPKRKLVLVRRDDVEHLILIGGQNDLVVEPGIVRGQARRPRQEPGFAEPEQRPVPPQQALPHRRTPRPGVQPVPSEAQAPGAHPPIAPVAEGRVDPIPETRAVMGERGPAAENRAPNVAPAVIPVVPEQRSEPIAIPHAPIVAPPAPVVSASAPPVAPPPRIADEAPAPRRSDAGFPPEPTPASRRGHDASVETPQVVAPVSRPMPPVAPAEPAPRRAEPMPASSERIEPPLMAPEPPRQVPVVPPVAPPRPVAPPLAQTVVPPAPASQPVAPSAAPTAARPATPPSPPAPPTATPTPLVQAPVAPRSMATPTLPQLSRATPVAPQPRSESEVTSARSLWSPAPSAPVGPLPAEPSSDASSRPERDTSPADAAPTPAPMPERIPVRWPPAPVAPRADESAKAEVGFAGPAADAVDPSPAPLSVKSFATTIQERRATVPAETLPSAPTVRTPQAPQVEPAPAPMQAPAAPVAQREPEVASQTPPEAERTLTLEEEMERLLHDFTIDVSERR